MSSCLSGQANFLQGRGLQPEAQRVPMPQTHRGSTTLLQQTGKGPPDSQQAAEHH